METKAKKEKKLKKLELKAKKLLEPHLHNLIEILKEKEELLKDKERYPLG